MMERLRWHDVWQVEEQLTDLDRRILGVLVHIPFLWTEGIVALASRRRASTIYDRLRRLREAGLIVAMRVSLDPGCSPRYFHFTDLGLAVVASARARDPVDLAREKGIRGSDLRVLLPRLAQLRATYAVLIALAGAHPGDVEVLSFDRSWRPDLIQWCGARPIGVYPSLVTLSWERIRRASFLLLADRATFPLRVYHAALAAVLRGQWSRRSGIPPLVIATSRGGRVHLWENLLSALGRSRGVAFPAVRIVTWDDLDDGLAGIVGSNEARWSVVVPRSAPPERSQRLPADGSILRSVGQILPRSINQSPNQCHPAQLAVTLKPVERTVLDLLSRHPFLNAGDLARIFGWSVPWARERSNSLVGRGLLRLLHGGVVETSCGDGLVEATAAGLELVAAHQGLSLAMAVRQNGLAGGGPDHPVGSRRILLAHREHTRGVDKFFIRLVTAARAARAVGGDDALLEWQNASACAHGAVRPDGYGVYRHNGHRYSFFLEYDRATTRRRDYREKFAAYARYRESGRFASDYGSFPTILVVTTQLGTEVRIARAIRTIGRGHLAVLPVLLTTVTRIAADPESMLGPIWREVESPVRRRWMQEPRSMDARGQR